MIHLPQQTQCLITSFMFIFWLEYYSHTHRGGGKMKKRIKTFKNLPHFYFQGQASEKIKG